LGEGIIRAELPGGVRFLGERMPGVRSVALGVWVGVGSRDERPSLAGASHYLEHMIFKGTPRRSARDIAETMDAIGGDLNAFTGKEYTCFYARVLDRDLPLAVDVLSDMIRNSRLAVSDFTGERNVVLEEISMYEDSPDELVHDVFGEAIYGNDPLGRPVLGSAKSIGAVTRQSLAGFYRRHYRPDRIVVAAAGNISRQSVLDLAAHAFGGMEKGEPGRRDHAVPRHRRGLKLRCRPTEQAHLVLGTRGVARDDPRRFAVAVLNQSLGGGMSSRLFQEVREKRGLVYSIYSQHVQHGKTGYFSVYAGTSPSKAREVLGIVREEMAKAAAHGLTPVELERGKGHLQGILVLSLEDSAGRMSRLGKSELTGSELLSVNETLRRIRAVTLEDVKSVARDLLDGGPWALGAVGPLEETDLEEFIA